MDAGLLDVLQEPADDHVLAVRDAVDVDLDGVFQELVDQDRLCLGIGHRLEGDGHVARELLGRVHDFHGAPAEDVARPHDDREADLLGDGESVLGASRDAAARAVEAELGEQLVEALAVLGTVDGIGSGAEDAHAGAR